MNAQNAKARILVVEDEADIRDLLEIVLMSRGYQVATAENGRVGLEVLQGFRPDLVLADLSMPDLDGLGFLEGKSRLPDVAAVPVIVLSARDKNGDVMQAIERGASNYITKPFDTKVVLSNIERLLSAAPGANG
jgi:DNA-binding response OmpR family regulator